MLIQGLSGIGVTLALAPAILLVVLGSAPLWGMAIVGGGVLVIVVYHHVVFDIPERLQWHGSTDNEITVQVREDRPWVGAQIVAATMWPWVIILLAKVQPDHGYANRRLIVFITEHGSDSAWRACRRRANQVSL